jgi:hypothetical protein
VIECVRIAVFCLTVSVCCCLALLKVTNLTRSWSATSELHNRPVIYRSCNLSEQSIIPTTILRSNIHRSQEPRSSKIWYYVNNSMTYTFLTRPCCRLTWCMVITREERFTRVVSSSSALFRHAGHQTYVRFPRFYQERTEDSERNESNEIQRY